jgi:hypothetical protein
MSQEYNTFKTPEEVQREAEWLANNTALRQEAEELLGEALNNPALKNQMTSSSSRYTGYTYTTSCDDQNCQICHQEDPSDRIISIRRSFFQKLKDLFDPTK